MGGRKTRNHGFRDQHPEVGGEHAGGKSPGKALKLVKEQSRRLPDHGIGYGLLRYLNAETAPVLAAMPQPEIAFNYLGRLLDANRGRWKAGAIRRCNWRMESR